MRKHLSIACITLLGSFSAFSQLTNGLIAHWDMNETTNDVTGHGHVGIDFNLTPAVGRNGVAGNAYEFNGVNSRIAVQNFTSFDLTTFSICATVKVTGFNHGTCQRNTIFERGGTEAVTGSYSLVFDDNAFDNSDCAALDTTKEVFRSTAGINNTPSVSDWQYSPTILPDTWYTVVVTYASPEWRVFVNDVLVKNVDGPGVVIGNSWGNISIGMDFSNSSAGSPYPFKGVIDDIRLYNRPLMQDEVIEYTKTTGIPVGVAHVTTEPDFSVSPNPATNNVAITLPANINKADMFVLNTVGSLVMQRQLSAHASALDISALPAGIYLIKLQIDNQTATRKLVKQ
jgi:hypothetical protein